MASSKEITQINNIVKGLNTVDATINKVSTSYMSLVTDIEKGNKIINDNAISFDNLKKAQTSTKESGEKLDKLDKQLEATKKRLTQLDDKREQQRIKNNVQIQKQTKSIKDLNRAKIAEKGSTEQLAAVNVILEKRLRNVNQTTDEGKKSADLLRSAIDKNNEKITEQSSAFVKTKRGIGGYTEGIKEAFGELGIFGGALSQVSSFQDKFNALITGSGKSFKAAAQGTTGASKALRIFKVALISTGIGLIIVAIGAFVALLSKTQKFTDALNVALSAVGAVMDVLVGTVSKLAGVFSKLFKQPLSETFKQAGDAVDGLSDSIVEAAKKGAELEKLRQSVKRLGFEFDVSNAKATQQIELLKAIADDATKSFAERKKANQDAIESQEKASAAEFKLFETRKKLADAEFERLKATGNLNDDAREAHSIATKEFIDAETKRLLITRDLEKQRTELKQDELEKNLDILIDGFDNQKTINERLIADDTLTLKKRESILNETKDLFEVTFAKQIETIEQFTNASVNANDLIATSDAVVLNEKIRSLGLSEIIEGRLLEIIRERRIAIQDLNEAEQSLTKIRIDDLKVIEDASEKEFETHIENLEAGIDAEIEAEENKQERLLTAEIDGRAKREAKAIEDAEKQKQFEQGKALEIVSIATTMGDSLGALASGQIKTFKEFSKQILLISLDVIEKKLLLAQTAILIQDVSKIGFLGFATAAAKFVLLKAAFTGVKGIISSFNMGTDNAPNEFIAGDKKGGGSARELMFLRDGTTMMVNEPTYFKGDKFKGAKIKSNIETEAIMANQGVHKNISIDTDGLMIAMNRVEKAINKKPVSITDQSGRVIGQQSGNARQIYLERLQNGR